MPASAPQQVDKVVAYLLQTGLLAVFRHDNDHDPLTESGLQVPAGTRCPGEDLGAAVLREAQEETGVRGLRVVRFLGESEYDMRPYSNTVHRRHFFQLSCTHLLPDTWQHVERDGGAGPPRPFTFSWLEPRRAHVLAAGQGALLGRLVHSAPELD